MLREFQHEQLFDEQLREICGGIDKADDRLRALQWHVCRADIGDFPEAGKTPDGRTVYYEKIPGKVDEDDLLFLFSFSRNGESVTLMAVRVADSPDEPPRR
jgi:hypothetical protein